jgi:hypothetical protein
MNPVVVIGQRKRYVFRVSLTARDLLRKVARDSGNEYEEIARRVNRDMRTGTGFLQSVGTIVEEMGFEPRQYRINPVSIVEETMRILRKDYAQTLMMSAVLARMVESKGKDALPPPAFFAFLELLSAIPDRVEHIKNEPRNAMDDDTTRVIELLTTLVSIVCEWSRDGIKGVARDCPEPLISLARSVFRKTRLYQGGLWTCISCGGIVGINETHALVCAECDTKMARVLPGGGRLTLKERERTAYGHARDGESVDR